MIAVTGATGQLGRLVVEKLKQKVPASNLIALVRSPEKASDLGVNVRAADYDNPKTLVAALNGVDTLLLISSSEIGKRLSQHRNVINAAKQAGVNRVVYTSLLHADTSSLSLAEEHRQTEAELKASGLAFTILRHGWYTENYTGFIAGALSAGEFIGSAGDGKIAAATREDFAQAAAVVLTRDDQEGKIYELAGDSAWTLSELAAEVSRQTGRNIPYKNLPESDYASALINFGLPEPLAQALAGYDISASQGALFDDSHQLSTLIGRATTSLSAAVAIALKGQ
ncbi:NAD(P)H dehydrogenase (quinone) [Pseudomonas sp. BIGb0381]|uniref:SDR family oxidoreductase n=1 Tax=Pseudomonas sp. BIGb0381 TaxID=2940608 RepID=UPI00216768BF|nr:SDR family oxidoreductase [Pseudomonas sp. BIGb0381]MCS4314146.1 NAD(P)H dehydrogenase (quinone) [Pseudomonas sp. BIGb0381]